MLEFPDVDTPLAIGENNLLDGVSSEVFSFIGYVNFKTRPDVNDISIPLAIMKACVYVDLWVIMEKIFCMEDDTAQVRNIVTILGGLCRSKYAFRLELMNEELAFVPLRALKSFLMENSDDEWLWIIQAFDWNRLYREIKKRVEDFVQAEVTEARETMDQVEARFRVVTENLDELLDGVSK